MRDKPLVLLVEDSLTLSSLYQQYLDKELLEVCIVEDGQSAKDFILERVPDLVLLDLKLPDISGEEVLAWIKSNDFPVAVVIITAHGSVDIAVDVMRLGAIDFLEKPCAAADLLPVLERAFDARAQVIEQRALKSELERGDPAARLLFGLSAQAEALRERVRSVAPTGAEVLVTGPPGSGISKVAEVVHLMSPVGQGPFVKRPASGLTPEGLVRVCEDAAGGSLFLDEVSAMPDATQYAALEMIEQGTGSRIVAGTTADLAALSEQGKFNADLFYEYLIAKHPLPDQSP